jgi:hypothetical protein
MGLAYFYDGGDKKYARNLVGKPLGKCPFGRLRRKLVVVVVFSLCHEEALLTSALDGGQWSASRPGRFTPGERVAGAHWIGGWVGQKASVEAVFQLIT